MSGLRPWIVGGAGLAIGVAIVAGVLAALGPARSAGKTDVLKAVVTD
jgi:ABC-type antimicrobial peptide transport system permease subunit